MAKMGRPKNPPKFKELLKDIMPIEELFEEDELLMYNGLVDIYLNDFDQEDMTSGDMDDVMSLAMNKVLEVRLLKTSKGDPDKHLDISAAIEKIRKQNDKLRENLSSRRRDRINPNEFKGFSIVDLAVAFDDDKKLILSQKAKELEKEEEALLKTRSEYVGNRYDIDAEKREGEESR
jgi:hypothetical protein